MTSLRIPMGPELFLTGLAIGWYMATALTHSFLGVDATGKAGAWARRAVRRPRPVRRRRSERWPEEVTDRLQRRGHRAVDPVPPARPRPRPPI